MAELLSKEVIAAADFFNKTAKQLLADDGRLHAETLIASMARMSGSLMYRTFGFDANIQPGTSVLSDKANVHGPRLMTLMLVTLKTLGHEITEADLNPEFATAGHAQLGFKETEERLAPFFLKYCEAAPLGLGPAAVAAAVATGTLVHECAAVLPVRNGAAVAVYGLVEGTKTAPYTLQPSSGRRPRTTAPPKKPWFKFWQ